MEPGDHLITQRTGYTHHGIYVGNRRVIHYSGFANGWDKGIIEETSLTAFACGRHVNAKQYFTRIYSPTETVERAYSRLGEDLYNLLLNNCEHFATWCIFGLHSSAQVNSYLTQGLAGVRMYLDQEGQRRAMQAIAGKITTNPTVQRALTQAVGAEFVTAAANSAIAPVISSAATKTAAASLAQSSGAVATGLAAGGLASGSGAAVGIASMVGGSTLAAAAAPVAIGAAAAYGVYKLFDWLTD